MEDLAKKYWLLIKWFNNNKNLVKLLLITNIDYFILYIKYNISFKNFPGSLYIYLKKKKNVTAYIPVYMKNTLMINLILITKKILI